MMSVCKSGSNSFSAASVSSEHFSLLFSDFTMMKNEILSMCFCDLI